MWIGRSASIGGNAALAHFGPCVVRPCESRSGIGTMGRPCLSGLITLVRSLARKLYVPANVGLVDPHEHHPTGMTPGA